MKTFTLCLAMLAVAGLAKAQDEMTVIYSNDFEDATINAGCTINGIGEYVTCADAGHEGTVYKNGIDEKSIPRTNYLVLPSTVFADFDGQHGYNTLKVTVDVKLQESETQATTYPCQTGTDGVRMQLDGTGTYGTIPTSETLDRYFYSPLFSAYTEVTTTTNGLPMLICESRGTLQVNCYGWSDFTAANNVAGVISETTVWAGDHKWHSYEFVISTGTSYVKVDGETINEWWLDNVSDGQIMGGLFTNGNELDYVCLGGNQAWDWGDIDMPYYFDNLVISAGQTALSIDEIEAPTAEVVSVEYFNLSGAKVSEPTKGITLEKTTYSDGTTSVNKILK